ncbi:MAG: AAA domain-containing protein, partial [Pseudomonadota bacterium]
MRSEAVTFGLKPLVDAIENGSIKLEGVKTSFTTGYARWWLNSTVDCDEVLRGFISAEHEKRIADFKVLDDRVTQLTRDYIRASICSNLPGQEDSNKNSEWGILRREMQKKKRHIPLRELITSIPNTLTKLSPCLLMSPLSIAQYLSTETPMYDIVVFDEASQIPVWDAIGAIARGKQVVMVGDPKQLPPTSFFDRAESETDDEEVESDLESILDECIGANLPTLNLSWHYRSRHESLITFSNSRYYGGSLVTFPSPSTEDKAVSFHFISDGVYEKGGARINKPEARALVEHIISRLKGKELKSHGLSIGVITFNSEQQRLIEDLLDNERRKNPALESFFADEKIEPIFVKNLESVQGDERDVIYFSVAYGPDVAGSISMNFGPMNRDGGERRLNVAITRARHELLIFSSLKPEQIDLSRTSAVGVRDLKHFMEFAERGPKAIAEAVYGITGDYDSPFEKAVARALTNRGWQVHPQVGVSSFRIDLGIVDPDAPGRYLAGIECDGATYHRSATARDRDKLRAHVLKGLGWHINRIWSTDWWIDSADALEKLDSNLTKLLEESRAHRAEEDLNRQETEAFIN